MEKEMGSVANCVSLERFPSVASSEREREREREQNWAKSSHGCETAEAR